MLQQSCKAGCHFFNTETVKVQFEVDKNTIKVKKNSLFTSVQRIDNEALIEALILWRHCTALKDVQNIPL